MANTVRIRTCNQITRANFNSGSFFFLSKALSWSIFSILFRVSNHHTVDKYNLTEFAFQALISEFKFRTNPGFPYPASELSIVRWGDKFTVRWMNFNSGIRFLFFISLALSYCLKKVTNVSLRSVNGCFGRLTKGKISFTFVFPESSW